MRAYNQIIKNKYHKIYFPPFNNINEHQLKKIKINYFIYGLI